MSPAPTHSLKQPRQRFLDELKDFLRIPSISTLPEHRSDIERAAAVRRGRACARPAWKMSRSFPTEQASAGLCRLAARAGQADGALLRPLRRAAGRPAGAVGNPAVRAHGAQRQYLCPRLGDDKGQMYMHIKAIEALRAVNGTLPVNVKFLIEGEEEVGGESIAKYVAENAEKLQGRCRAGFRHRAVRRGHADAVHRTARTDLHGSGSHRTGARSAFGPIRRRRAQRGLRADRTAGEGQGCERRHSDSRAFTTMSRRPLRRRRRVGSGCRSRRKSS